MKYKILVCILVGMYGVHAQSNQIHSDITPEKALLEAADLALVPELQQLIEEFPDLIEVQDEHGNTPLLLAAGKIPEQFAQEEAQGYTFEKIYGNTQEKFIENRLALVKYLVAHGANIAHTNTQGQTALERAQQAGHTNIAAYLSDTESMQEDIRRMQDYIPFLASQGKFDTVKRRITADTDVALLESALRTAIARNNLPFIQYLVPIIKEKGGAIDAVDTNGRTALMWAAYYGNMPVLDYLIVQGADIHKKDKDGQSALFKAALQGQVEVVQYLLKKGMDVMQKDRQGKTALEHVQQRVRAVKTASERTAYQAIMKLLREKQQRSPLQKVGDTIERVFI
jgi:ankyrin repeat protein